MERPALRRSRDRRGALGALGKEQVLEALAQAQGWALDEIIRGQRGHDRAPASTQPTAIESAIVSNRWPTPSRAETVSSHSPSRTSRADEQGGEPDRPTASEEDEQRGPQEIELLLDRERPGVADIP